MARSTAWRASSLAEARAIRLAGLVLAALVPLVALVLLAEEAEAAPTYRVWATREGLVGGTTANGHVIKERDHFVALPTREALTCNGCFAKQVRVCNPLNGRCETAPVWDVGPWNIHDDWWSASAERDIYAWLDHGGRCCLRQGLPEAQAAYESGYNSGRDEFGRTVLNRAGIDLADGTFWDGLGMSTNGWVDATLLWLPDPAPSDTTPPETSASLAGTPGDSGWWVSSVTVKLSATDGGSGVGSTRYRVDLGPWRTYTGPFTLSADGVRRVDYDSVDKAGNREPTETITVKIDEVPPSTTHALAGALGDEGWWRSAVTVSLSASDATSGVAGTTATRDGSGFAYVGPFSVAGEGSHSLSYRSRDRAGNVEGLRSAALRIDTVAPSTGMAHGSPAHLGSRLYVSGATPFTLIATDATSGVRATSWRWQGAETAYGGGFTLGGPDGPATLEWRSEDRAGNAEPWRSRSIYLDNTPPSLSLAGPPEGALLASLEPIPVEPEASDAGSGVARVEFRVDGVLRSTDSAAPYRWDWPVGDEALGEHVLTVTALDHLGHAASLQRKVTTAPTSQAGVLATLQKAKGAAPPADPGALPGAAAAALEKARALLEQPPRLPVVGVVAEADPAAGRYRVGLLVDGSFYGLEGALPF